MIDIVSNSILECKMLLEAHNNTGINTEVWVNRGKSDIVIAVGESWTWGDSMGGNHVTRTDNINHRINNNLSTPSVVHYDSDLCLAALPGGCNINIMLSLRRLITEAKDRGYKTIRCIIQITEPARDWAQANNYWIYELDEVVNKAEPIQPIIDYMPYDYPYEYTKYGFFEEILKKPIILEDYYIWYHNRLKELYDKFIHQENVKYVFWRNFTRWATTPYENSMKLAMTEFISQKINNPIKAPLDLNDAMWKNFVSEKNQDWPFLNIQDSDQHFLENELDLVLTYFDWNVNIGDECFCGAHPNKQTHNLYGRYILDSGFLN